VTQWTTLRGRPNGVKHRHTPTSLTHDQATNPGQPRSVPLAAKRGKNNTNTTHHLMLDRTPSEAARSFISTRWSSAACQCPLNLHRDQPVRPASPRSESATAADGPFRKGPAGNREPARAQSRSSGSHPDRVPYSTFRHGRRPPGGHQRGEPDTRPAVHLGRGPTHRRLVAVDGIAVDEPGPCGLATAQLPERHGPRDHPPTHVLDGQASRGPPRPAHASAPRCSPRWTSTRRSGCSVGDAGGLEVSPGPRVADVPGFADSLPANLGISTTYMKATEWR